MFKNYATIALRNLLRHRLYSAINIGGMAVGLAAAVLILLFVRDEMSYDSFWPDGENVYRLEVDVRIKGRLPETFAVSSGPAKAALEKDFPQIEAVTRFFYSQTIVLKDGDSFFEVMTYADPNLFDVLAMPFLDGNAATASQDPGSLVITRDMAEKYFGGQPALGQNLTLTRGGQKKTYIVSGVIENMPENTHLNIDMIVPLDRDDFLNDDGSSFLENWGCTCVRTYIKFHPDTDIAALSAELDAFTDRNMPDELLIWWGTDKNSEAFGHYLVPVADIHLSPTQSGRISPGGDARAVQSFTIVSLLILLVASLNFVNLTTARSILRSKEVSLRKVMGAERKQIVVQFLSETFVILSVAMTVALVLVELALPWFNDFLSKLIILFEGADLALGFGLLGLLVLVALVAGFYPSFVVSGFRPADILRPGGAMPKGSKKLRAAFIIFQFSVSIGLIITTMVVRQQTEFAKSMELGFTKENVLVLRRVGGSDVRSRLETLMQELERNPDVISLSLSSEVPFDQNNNFNAIQLPGTKTGETVGINSRWVDESYFDTYEILILKGRNFSPEFGTDMYPQNQTEGVEKAAVILNAAAARKLGYASSDDALNQVLRLERGNDLPHLELTVVGIVPDVHLMPVNYEVEPMLFFYQPQFASALGIRFETGDTAAFLDFVGQTWKRIIPEVPVSRVMLSDQVDRSYDNDEARSTILGMFSALAVLISCFGLYGLTALSVEQRIKEIAVRKVMGARVFDIVGLLVWQFSKPVLAANLIAWPVAWYFLSDWLDGFVFRIDLGPVPFAMAGVGALIIAWATIGGRAYRVALTRPVNALRYE